MPHETWHWSADGLSLIDQDGIAILRIKPSPASQEQFDLIAAAPELLAACEHVLAVIGDEGECNHDTDEEWVRAIHEKLRPIIAKAKGA